ncbi:MAG: hypothetical protein KJO07_25880 [Deltaproteobacteria bacterium]|nr:hypothetical protein [Deltaproteobacteria bacterium]
MQPITVMRACAWLAVVLAGWSVNLRWGVDQMVRTGAPPQFERHVVGAALLAAIAALALIFAHPKRAVARKAAIVATIAALGSHAVAWWIRSLASTQGQPQLTDGTGWMWLCAGTALAIASSAGAIFLKSEPDRAKSKARR